MLCLKAAGSQPTTQATVKIVRGGGRIVWTGMAPECEFAIPVSEIIAKEVRISGQFRYANTYPTAIRLVSERRVDLRSMTTDTFAFHEIATALERCAAREPEIIKAVVRI